MDLLGTLTQLWFAMPAHVVCVRIASIQAMATHSHKQLYIWYFLHLPLLSPNCRDKPIADVVNRYHHGTDGILLHGSCKTVVMFTRQKKQVLTHSRHVNVFGYIEQVSDKAGL